MHRLVAPAILVLAALTLAACDSAPEPVSVPPPAPLGMSMGGGTPGTPGSPGKAGRFLHGCDLVSRDDIGKLTGATSLAALPQDGHASAGCTFTDAAKGISLIVLAYNYPAAKFGDPRHALEASMDGGPKPRALPGVGDIAEIAGDAKSATLAAAQQVRGDYRVTVLRGTSTRGLPWSKVLADLGRAALRTMQ